MSYLPGKITFFNDLAVDSARIKAVPHSTWYFDIESADLSPVPPDVELPSIGNLADTIDDKDIFWGEVKIEGRLITMNEVLIERHSILDTSKNFLSTESKTPHL